jgi:hypothetical protein
MNAKQISKLSLLLTVIITILSIYLVARLLLPKPRESYGYSSGCGYAGVEDPSARGACQTLNGQLAKEKRCQVLGGSKFNGRLYGGCNAEEGSEGRVSLCKGMHGKCSKSLSDRKAVSDYYGKTSQTGIDEHSQYFKEVEKAVVEALEYIGKNAASCLLELHKQNITPAIMFDIDDTVFSSYPFTRSVKWLEGEAKEMPLIKPVAMFIFVCKAMGILPIFITGRYPSAKNRTLEQLIVGGLVPGETFWGGATYNGGDLMRGVEKPYDVVPADVYAEKGTVQSFHGIFFNGSSPRLPASQYKEKVRCWIEKNGLANAPIKFIMSVGDQWSDSNGRCSGAKIKLPNPLYFIP